MGKKRIAIIDNSALAKEKKKPRESRLKVEDARHRVSAKGRRLVKTGLPSRRLVKTGKEHGRITDMGAVVLEEAGEILEKEKKLEKETLAKVTKKAKKVKKKPSRKRGKRYQEARKKVDRTKFYSLSEAIKLTKTTSISRFNGAVEVHLSTHQVGLKGTVKFPYGTGKSQRIAIATDELLGKIAKGKVDFDILLATPAMMPKLAKYAKILGPRGLMPNPKAGTVTDDPEKLARQLAGKVQFRTEAKAPLIHMVIGKVDSKERDLEENLKTLIEAVGKTNIKKAVLTSTMGPGIKVDLGSI